MAMTLKEVSTIFNELEFNHSHLEDDNLIISKGGAKGNTLAYFVRLREDGELFDMAGRLLDEENDQITAKGNPHTKVLMAYLLLRNYETKFGTWEFDSEEGTISFAVEIPLEDNNLTKKQIARIVKIMMSAGNEAGAIKSILKTGKLPIEGDEAAKKIAELEAMLAQLQGAGI